MNGQTTIKTLCMLACAVMIAGCSQSSEEVEVQPPDPQVLAKATPYPLTTCLVSGEPLDAMGGAVTIVEGGQEIKFCCKDCVSDFNSDKETYMAKLTKLPESVATPEVPETPQVPAAPAVPTP